MSSIQTTGLTWATIIALPTISLLGINQLIDPGSSIANKIATTEQKEQHETLRLAISAATKDWNWATGEGYSWLKQKNIDLKQYVKDGLVSKGIPLDQLSDERLMSEYIKKATQDNEGRLKHEARLHSPVNDMVKNGYLGWDYLKALKETEEKHAGDEVIRTAMAEHVGNVNKICENPNIHMSEKVQALLDLNLAYNNLFVEMGEKAARYKTVNNNYIVKQ